VSGNNGATISPVSYMDSSAVSYASANALQVAGPSATRSVPKYKRARRTNNPLSGLNTSTAPALSRRFALAIPLTSR
jgi:hypothetical protein